ncbi:MAG: oligosaccharide flippase family protein [Alistipes sp.]|jgi:O-antigen/teichoic acid export membrane protein|nr:oligosaccharide flippase family protein [Alistipes sp.]
MSGIRTLAGDTIIYGLSTILTRMLNYLMVPYLTRVMTAGEYGVVTDLYSLIPFALVLLTMGLESGYFRFAGKAADGDEKNLIFVTLWSTTIVAAMFFVGMASLFHAPIAMGLGYGDTPWIIQATALVIALDVATAMPFARLREQRRRIMYVVVRFVSVVVNLALCVVFYTLQKRTGAEWVLLANVVASAVALLLLIPTVRGVKWRADRAILRRVMVYSLPLLVSGIAGTAGEFIDRQMVKWLMPPEVAMSALGVYGAATKLAVIMILFTQMYRLAAEPFFLSRFGRGEFARQSGLAMKLYIAVAAVIFVVVMAAKPLVVLIVGEEFREGSHLLPILLGANALAGVVLNLSFWYKQAERTWMAIAVTGTGLAVALGLNMVLVPRMGYEGAAWARLACEAAMVVVSWILVLRIKKRYDSENHQQIGE